MTDDMLALQLRRFTMAIEANEAEIGRLKAALEQSVKLQSHYAELLNMHDGGKRRAFASAQEWIDRLKATEK